MTEQLATGDSRLSPTRTVAVMRRLAGPIWRLTGIAATLEVRGRASGVTQRVTFIPIQLDANVYAVAWGGVTDWALNLHAAGSAKMVRGRRTQAIRAIEVVGDERDAVIATYLGKMGPLKNDFNRLPRTSDHPVFRLEPTAR